MSFVSIKNNKIHNCIYGIFVDEDSNNNRLYENVITDCTYGIYIKEAMFNRIYSNYIFNNNFGIYLRDSGFNRIYDNIIVDNIVGIRDPNSHNNTINNNIVTQNEYRIVIDEKCSGNEIYYNSLIENDVQAEDNGNNTWDDGNGTGNYWDDYDFKDNDGDGIGDKSYSELDKYPIVEPPQNVPPIADADGPYYNLVGYPITLTAFDSYDPNDGDSLQYRWDFNHDGIWDTSWSTNPTAKYTWYSEYTGTVVVRVTDGDLTDKDTSSVIIKSNLATIDFEPDTLNLRSKGKQITCYIELPEGYDVKDINISSIILNGEVHAETSPIKIGDYDKDGIKDLMVKFNRAAVQAILEVGESESIMITGKLTDGTAFGGVDRIRVIKEVV